MIPMGQVAYEAYCQSTGNKSPISGAELPKWTDLKPEIQAEWAATAEAIAGRFRTTDDVVE